MTEKQKRQDFIKKKLKHQREITTTEIEEKFGVSKVTACKDLSEYGGLIKIEEKRKKIKYIVDFRS